MLNLIVFLAQVAHGSNMGISGKASAAARAGFPVTPGTRMAQIYKALRKFNNLKDPKGLAPLAYHLDQIEQTNKIDVLADTPYFYLDNKTLPITPYKAAENDFGALREELLMEVDALSASVTEKTDLETIRVASGRLDGIANHIRRSVKNYTPYNYFLKENWREALIHVEAVKTTLLSHADEVDKRINVARKRAENSQLHPARLVAYSPEGNLIASLRDNTVYLSQAETGKLVGQVITIVKNIRSVAFSENGRRIIIKGGDSITDRALLTVEYPVVYNEKNNPLELALEDRSKIMISDEIPLPVRREIEQELQTGISKIPPEDVRLGFGPSSNLQNPWVFINFLNKHPAFQLHQAGTRAWRAALRCWNPISWVPPIPVNPHNQDIGYQTKGVLKYISALAKTQVK